MTHRHRPVRFLAALLAATIGIPTSSAQQEIAVEIDPSKAASLIRIAVPFPQLAPGVAASTVQQSLYSPLTRDLAWSDMFGIVALPPDRPASIDTARAAKAQAFLKVDVSVQGQEYVIEARLYDVNSKAIQMAKRYRGSGPALTRIAHTIANDLVRHFNGKPGIFLTQIAFVSTRDGTKEIYVMDFDGSNQRRITAHRTISLSPKWSPDSEQLAYTSFSRGTSDLYLINRRGGGRVRLDTGVNLNTSPSFSPDGREIAFVGSVRGNPDIYVIGKGGGSPRRLTSANTIESTPAFNPTGRQIAFTSSRTGTPQIYLMDAEGTNVRRLSFDGNWNDDAAWAPGGDYLAYTSRVSGRFQIRIVNLSTMQGRIIAGEGSNEQPAWAPDGRSLVFTSNRTGRWQIYRVNADGTNMVQLTFDGENTAPNWSSPAS
jgi:TolB protein